MWQIRENYIYIYIYNYYYCYSYYYCYCYVYNATLDYQSVLYSC